MKPSCGKNFTKRGTFPLHTSRNGLARSLSKKGNQLRPANTTKPGAPRHPLPRSKEKQANFVDDPAVSYDCDDVEVTPLNDKNTRKDEASDDDDDDDNNTATTKTPPPEASVSPEIQMMFASTPATGHHHMHSAVSGIADNRKCRARGLLAAGNAAADGENALPLPSHASMHWLNHHSPTLPFATNSSPTTPTCNSSDSSNNVMRTPTSADSDSSVAYLDTLLTKTSQFRSQLDSVAESLRATTIDISFEFDTVVAAVTASSSSVDLSHFRPQLLRDSCCSEIDDIDQSDFCRCSSDDEHPEFVFDDIVPPPLPLEPEEARRRNYASGSCAESISTDGGGPLASKDSDWDFDQQL